MTRKGCLLLVLALAGPGCFTPTAHLEEEATKMPPVQTVEAPPPPPVVTPDQVTESNAVEMARALAQEMDQDAMARPSAPPMAAMRESAAKP